MWRYLNNSLRKQPHPTNYFITGKHRPFVMHLKCSLLLQFTSLTILWCYHKDWLTHHCHMIRVKLFFRSPIQEPEIIPFLLDTGTACCHLACWISFCLKAKSGRRGIGLILVPAALLFPSIPGRSACNPVVLLCAFEENVDPTHTSPLYQIYPFSVRDPTDPPSATFQTEGSDSVKSGGWCQVELSARMLSLAYVSQRSIWNVQGCEKTEMLFLSDHSRWTDHQQKPRIREERNEKANRDIQSISLLIHSQFCQDHMPDEIQLRFPRGLSYDPIVLTVEIFPNIQLTFYI